MSDINIEDFAESVEDDPTKENILRMTPSPDVPTMPDPTLQDPKGIPVGPSVISPDVLPSSRTSAFEKAVMNIQAKGAELKSAAEFYQPTTYTSDISGRNVTIDGAQIAEQLGTQISEYWGMSIGAFKGVVDMITPDDGRVGVHWDNENYERLIESSAPEHRESIFEARSITEAEEIKMALERRDMVLGINRQSMGGGAVFADLTGYMTDPLMWATALPAAKAGNAAVNALTTTKKLAGATMGAGIMGGIEASVGYMYASLAQRGDPTISDQEVADWAVWGGIFGSVFGGTSGFLGALRRGNIESYHKQVRVEHSKQVLQELGPSAHAIFDNVMRFADPDTVRMTMDELVEARLKVLRNVPENGTSPLTARNRVTGVIDDLSPEGYAELLEQVNRGLTLRRAEYISKKLRKLADEGHALAFTKQDIVNLSGKLSKGELTSIEVAQARLLQETDVVGTSALNQIIEGQALALAPEEIKWLVRNTPEVFGPKGIDLDAVMRGKRMRMADERKVHANRMRKRKEELVKLANRPFKPGDVVMTPDGRIGRIASITEDALPEGTPGAQAPAKVQLESLELLETRKLLKKAQEDLAKAEGKTKAMVVKKNQRLIDHLNKRIAELTDESMRMADEVFDAPVAAAARFLLEEELETLAKATYSTKDVTRYAGKTVRGKVKKQGAIKSFKGRIFGEEVTAKSSMTLPKGGGKVPVNKRWWQFNIGGHGGKNGIKAYSESWWENELKQGRIKETSPEYINRIIIEDGKGVAHIKRQLEDIIRREVMTNYSKKVIKKNESIAFALNRADDPPNVVYQIADGVIPPEIRAVLPKEFVDDVLIEWAKRHKDLPEEVLEKLRKGEEVELPDTVKGADVTAASADAPRLDPVYAALAGRFGENMWGLTHEIGAVRRLYSLTFGSWLALTDPATGAAIAAGGASDSILAGGAMNYNRMQVKAMMAPFVETMIENTRKYKKLSSYSSINPLHIGKADDEFQRFIKAFIEDDVLDGVPRGAEDLVKESAEAYRKTMSEVLEWAKANGVEELTNVKPNKYYFPRFRNHAAMERIIKDKVNGGQDVLDELLERSLKEATPTMSDSAAKLLATKIRRYYMSPTGSRTITDHVLGIKSKDVEEFVDTLDDILSRGEGGRLTTDEKLELIKELGPTFKTTRHAQQRIPLNMQTRVLKPIDGKMLRVSDLFETNVTAALERYTIDMVSTAQKRAILKEFTTDEYAPKTIEGLIDNILDAAGRENIPAGALKDHLELVRKYLDNEPKFTRGAFTSTLAVARQYATMLKLPGFVPAQLPEAFMATFNTGLFRRMAKSMPVLNKMRQGALDGTYSQKDAAKYVQLHLGMGAVEHDLSLLYAHHELIEEGSTLVSGKVIGRLYGIQSHVIPRISRMSGFRQINVYSDLVAHRNFVDLLIDAAKTNNTKLFSQKRLATLGIDQDDFNEILDALRQDGVINKEIVGSTEVLTLNSDMLAPNTAAKFRTMSAANIRQTVQRSHTWDMPKWLIESPTGEFLTQFRTFSMSAMSNHFARNLQAMDRFAFSHVSTMFAGGLATHWAMSYLHFHDDPVRLRESLTDENWVKGALIRSGFMGMIPDLVDAPMSLVTGSTLFSPSNKAMLLSIPVFDMLRDIKNATQTTYKMATGQNTYGAEQYQFRKVIPLTNLLYWRILTESMFANDFPL